MIEELFEKYRKLPIGLEDIISKDGFIQALTEYRDSIIKEIDKEVIKLRDDNDPINTFKDKDERRYRIQELSIIKSDILEMK